jgi:hypothetical protein
MKRVQLTIKEFYNFRILARKYAIKFLCEIVHENIIVEADINQLESLGY